jgi:hypothetical protein
MADMPFRRPALQQQFVPRTSTSFADCTATAAAMAADAATRGKWVIDHSDVRRRTNEPVPDSKSPGLTLQQVSASVDRITRGEARITVNSIRRSYGDLIDRTLAGSWAIVALWRGTIVDAGFGGSATFRQGHAVFYGYDQNEMAFVMLDPLVPKWMRVPPALVGKACREYLVRMGAGAGVGDAYFALTPDVYKVTEAPPEVVAGGDVMFNVAPLTTHRDVVLKPNTVLYEDSGLTERYSHSGAAQKAFGFAGSGNTYHAIVNGGYTNYVRREDVLNIIENDREHE